MKHFPVGTRAICGCETTPDNCEKDRAKVTCKACLTALSVTVIVPTRRDDAKTEASNLSKEERAIHGL